MSKRGTIGYQAEMLRKKGKRRVERLEAVLKSENTTQRVRNWAKQQISEIKSAMQGTRQYSTTGKRYKSKSQAYIKGQISRLEVAVAKVAPRYTITGDTFEVTQRELNKASVGLPSAYTKEEVKVFYRVTQRIWQREGIGEHNRNQAIMDYYNSIREENGLSPLRFDEIVDYVMNENKRVTEQMGLLPSQELTPEQAELYEEAQSADSEDYDKTSPTSEIVVAQIRDAMENLLVDADITVI